MGKQDKKRGWLYIVVPGTVIIISSNESSQFRLTTITRQQTQQKSRLLCKEATLRLGMMQLDLDETVLSALNAAKESDLVAIAGLLDLYSILNQDQYHATITNNPLPLDQTKFDSIVKSTLLKPEKIEPNNKTNPVEIADRLASNDSSLTEVNLNNIRDISKDTLLKIFEALRTNTHLKEISLCNIDLTDGPTVELVESLKHNSTLRVLNLESNSISGAKIRDLIGSLLVKQTIQTFRACNQRSQVMGNQIEMDITKLVEKNETLTTLSLNFDVSYAKVRVSRQLLSNIDAIRLKSLERIQKQQ